MEQKRQHRRAKAVEEATELVEKGKRKRIEY